MIGQYFRGYVGVERFGFDWNLSDFTIGLIPLVNVAYFVALTVFMLYLNLIVISKRHWSRGQQVSIGGQFLIRAASLAVALIAAVVICNTAFSSLWTRADLTDEKLFTLDKATVETLNKVKSEDRAVTIQAFVSRDVPRKFVNTRKQFVGLLRQFSEYGGGNVTVRFVDVTPNSQAALDARQSGVEPQDDRSDVGGRTIEQEVFLGATISSSLGDATIPFVDNDSSIEYELSRSLATTIDKKQRVTLGIVDTDAHFGGPEFEGRRIDWAYNTTLDELKKQCTLKYISQNELTDYIDAPTPPPAADGTPPPPARKTKKAPDVMLVADPSSLDDAAMAALVQYIEAGKPTIILADPLPFFWTFQNPVNLGVLNAPRQPRVSQQSPYAQILSSSPMPKSDRGTASKLLKAIGVDWDNGAAAWSMFNPHTSFKGEWPEYLGNGWPEYYGKYEKAFVFVRDHGETEAFNREDVISSGLKEMLMLYPGSIRKSADSQLDFQPLLRLGKDSGSTPWDSLTKTPMQRARTIDPRTGQMKIESQPARSQITNDSLIVMEPNPRTMFDDDEHILAARISGSGENAVNVVFIADLDFVSDIAYMQEESLEQKLDNLSLLQNSIEVLAGNDAFVALRNRRANPRTLVKLETVFEAYRSGRIEQQQAAEKEMSDELAVEQAKLDDATKEIQANESLSFFQKLQRTSQEASDAQRRFEMRSRTLEKKLQTQISKLETDEQNSISSVENWTRYASIFTAPLPALLLGFIVLWFRYFNEQKNITPERRV